MTLLMMMSDEERARQAPNEWEVLPIRMLNDEHKQLSRLRRAGLIEHEVLTYSSPAYVGGRWRASRRVRAARRAA